MRESTQSSPLPPTVLIPAAGVGMTWMGIRLGSETLLICGLTFLGVSALSVYLSARARDSLVVKRRHQERVFEEEMAHVQLQIENRGRWPIVGFEIRDSFPPAEVHRIRMMDRRTLHPGNAVELGYRRICARHRGVYHIGPSVIEASDPLGLFPFEIENRDVTDLLVYPLAEGLEFFPLLSEGTLTRVGEEIIPEPGESVEHSGVREWRPSDGMRRIHWPTTARMRRLMAKEFEQDVVTEVTLTLDLRRIAATGLGEHSTIEYAIRACAALARKAIERQHLVQVWGLGRERTCHIPFGAGPRHLTSILDLLTLLRADGRGDAVDDFERVVPTLRRGATLVMIISAAAFDADRMIPQVQSLTLEGVRVVAVVIDDRSLMKISKDQEVLHREALDLDDVLLQLREAGALLFTTAAREEIRERLETPV